MADDAGTVNDDVIDIEYSAVRVMCTLNVRVFNAGKVCSIWRHYRHMFITFVYKHKAVLSLSLQGNTGVVVAVVVVVVVAVYVPMYADMLLRFSVTSSPHQSLSCRPARGQSGYHIPRPEHQPHGG